MGCRARDCIDASALRDCIGDKRCAVRGPSQPQGGRDPARRVTHPKVASERAGHSSVATTLDLSSHVTENLQREAAEKVDMAMRKALVDRI